MSRIVRGSLCTAGLVLVAAPVGALAQQANAGAGAGLTACSLVDAAELKQITGRVDYIKRGPIAAAADEVPKGVSECNYLGIDFSLTSGMTREWFESTRASQVKGGTKTEALAGLGEDAYYYWDPRPGGNRQVGIAYRKGSHRLVVSDLTTSDSVQIMKPMLLRIAQTTVARLR